MTSSTELSPLEPPPPVALAVALDILARVGATHPLDVQTLPLSRLRQRVLAEPCTAPLDQPPFDNAAMDGIALRASDLGEEGCRLRVLDTVLAGHAHVGEVPAGACVRITTGSVMPAGTDTVVVKEVLDFDQGEVTIPPGQRAGANVRKAGESLRRGQPALAGGTRLGARHVALLASLGMDSARVRRAPRISIFSTGDELRAPGTPLAEGQIHDSNGAMLAAQAEAAACTLARQGHLDDRPGEQLAALRQAAADSDIIVTAGGVSMGEADYLPRLLNTHGRIHFWRVRMKPGLPVLFGELDNCLVVGLPGNPVSAAVGFHVLVRHLLQAIEAAATVAPLSARLRSGIRKQHRRAEFVRGRLLGDAQGGLWFEAHPQQGSAQLLGLAASDCLALLEEDARDPEAGSVCRVWPLDGGMVA